jgi:hypothetical protein
MERLAFAKLAEAAERYRATTEANRHFQRMVEILMNRWVDGTLVRRPVEEAVGFRAERTGLPLSEVSKDQRGGVEAILKSLIVSRPVH